MLISELSCDPRTYLEGNYDSSGVADSVLGYLHQPPFALKVNATAFEHSSQISQKEHEQQTSKASDIVLDVLVRAYCEEQQDQEEHEQAEESAQEQAPVQEQEQEQERGPEQEEQLQEQADIHHFRRVMTSETGFDTKRSAMTEQLLSEASDLHGLVIDTLKLLPSDAGRTLLAHSAALVGKSLKMEKVDNTEFVQVAEAVIDCRDELLQALRQALLEAAALHEQDPWPDKLKEISFKIASLSARLGAHQRTRPPPPTTKTKRPKAHHKRQ